MPHQYNPSPHKFLYGFNIFSRVAFGTIGRATPSRLPPLATPLPYGLVDKFCIIKIVCTDSYPGAANETIYADADHYWSMDSSYNFIDHKAKHVSWGRVEGEVALSKGVNHMSVELKNDDGEIELLNGHPCFVRARTCSDHGITISFWFKSIEQEDSAIERRVFFQTGTVDQHTGFYMVQGDTAGDIIFQLRKAGQLCSYNVHVEPNLWSFITVTFQKVEDLQVFRNGINVTPRQKCVSFQSDPNHNGKFVLGNGGNHCSALFDDVAIWYRRLSDEDIERTYSYYYKGQFVMVLIDFEVS